MTQNGHSGHSDVQPVGQKQARARSLVAFFAVAAVFVSSATSAPASDRTRVPANVSPFAAASWDNASSNAYNPKSYPGDMYWVTQEVTGAASYWNAGYTGAGVDVAVIDTGVVKVEGLATPGKIVHAPDFSFDTVSEPLRYLDAYGHGTHMAGIIAGKDGNAGNVDSVATADASTFVGMAPDARIVNVKVGNLAGVVDVSQVIAAIDWVVQNRKSNGLNIRVINLSYGTDGDQTTLVDPLAYAVERAWTSGIVVVVAAGNDGNATALRNPAYDPYVIAVGAAEGGKTYATSDDSIPTFSNCGTSGRHVDLVAPGKSIVGLRNPGSTIDVAYPEAVVADRFFLGSGTSQAAAVVSGAAALVINQQPGISPDQLKSLLMKTAQPIPNAKGICQGAGMLDLVTAKDTATQKVKQDWKPSSGKGSLEKSRGSFHVELAGEVLAGEQDIFGNEWIGLAFYKYAEAGLNWFDTGWSGLTWSGLSWSGLSWSGLSWSGLSWSGLSWSGLSWSGLSWSTTTWSGLSWKGKAL